jgi:hypothetical protein
MNRSLRRIFHLAGILAIAALVAAGSAHALIASDSADAVDGTFEDGGEPRPTRGDSTGEIDGTFESSGEPTLPGGGVIGAMDDLTGGVEGGVATQCFPLTPVIHAISVSVPASGSGLGCTHDDQCSGAGEFCGFPRGSTSGTCQASGLLSRGDIHYVAGGVVDVDVTLPECTFVSDVLMNGASIGGSSDGIDSSGSFGWFTVLSTAATLVDGQRAVRHTVRVQFSHYGFGASFALAVQARARVGGETTTSDPFMVADVDAVNAAMRNSVAETRLRNGFVTSFYRKFGDYEQIREDGELKAHRPDWSELPWAESPVGIGFADASDIRIGDDSVMFSMHFQGTGCGDIDVNAIGWFDLVPFGDGLDLVWLEGPRVGDDGGLACNVLMSLWELVAGDLFDESALADEIGASVEGGFGVDGNNHLEVCPNCRMLDSVLGNQRIDIFSVPPVDRVRVRVSTTRRTDPTADPDGQGLIIPADTYAPIAAGGTYWTCQASDGQSPATCAPQFAVDMQGLFNWWGNDVPVPSPIAYDSQGKAFVLGGRQHAWERLEGVLRDVTKLPEPSFPVGALLSRRTARSTPTSRALVSNGCVMPPVGAPYRVAFGVNDVAVPAAGDPPTSGELEVTVLLTDVPSQSEELFSGNDLCQGSAEWAVATDLVPPQLDGDADGIADASDNCPVWPNPSQSDVDANGTGDDCECGDPNGDGIVDVGDMVAINRAIFGSEPASALCDANGDGLCDVGDMVAVNRRIFGGPAYCARNPAPAP